MKKSLEERVKRRVELVMEKQKDGESYVGALLGKNPINIYDKSIPNSILLRIFNRAYNKKKELDEKDKNSLDVRFEFLGYECHHEKMVMCSDSAVAITGRTGVSSGLYLEVLWLIKHHADKKYHKWFEGVVEAGLNTAELLFKEGKIYELDWCIDGNPEMDIEERGYDVKNCVDMMRSGLDYVFLTADAIGKKDYFIERLNQIYKSMPDTGTETNKKLRKEMEEIVLEYSPAENAGE